MAEIECGNLMEQMMQAHHHLLQKNPEDDDVCQDFVGVLSPSFELEPELQVA